MRAKITITDTNIIVAELPDGSIEYPQEEFQNDTRQDAITAIYAMYSASTWELFEENENTWSIELD